MPEVTQSSKEQVTLRLKRLDWLDWLLLTVVVLQGFYFSADSFLETASKRVSFRW